MVLLIGPPDAKDRLKSLEKEKERLEKEYEELQKKYERGEISKEEYERRKHDIEREFVEVMDRITQYKAFTSGF
ncbi:MAG: SHOCT domain-containing protein [Thermoproteota archaeon]|nr:SHOCT domain-containing protein [Candidatus Brockarchaeota archaeon]